MAKKFESYETVIINTGNILSINEVTKKPNQNTTEEVRIHYNNVIKL